MAVKIHKFRGISKWAKVQDPVFKYQSTTEKETTIDLYLDDESWDEYEASGCRAKRRNDDEGDFIKLKRPEVMPTKKGDKYLGIPMIVDEKDNIIDALLGNGSEVTVKVKIYDTKYGKGTRMEAILVHKLEEYEGGEEADEEVGEDGEVIFKF